MTTLFALFAIGAQAATLSSSLSAGGSFAEAPIAARAAVPPAPYCVARLSTPTKGGPPYWYRADCKNGAVPKTESKFCVRYSGPCMDEVEAMADRLMDASGYELAGTFKFRDERAYERVYRLKGRRAGSYCLAHRSLRGTKPWGGAPAVQYVVDCGNGTLLTLDNAETSSDAVAGIQRHMAKDGYAQVDSYDFGRDIGVTTLLFRR